MKNPAEAGFFASKHSDKTGFTFFYNATVC